MSSNAITPYDEERMSLSMLVESLAEPESDPPDSGSDTLPEVAFEQLLELLSIASSADDDDDDDDDADIISNFAHPSMSNQDIFGWQENISAEPGTSTDLVFHIARAPVHFQAGMGRYRWPEALRTHCLSHAVSGPNCWVGLSVGEPQTDVSFRHFGMVHWTHTPYVSFGSQYTLPRTFQCFRTPLGSLNGVLQRDTAEPDGASTVFYPHSLLPLSSS